MLTKPGQGGRINFKTIKQTASGRPKFNSRQTAKQLHRNEHIGYSNVKFYALKVIKVSFQGMF